MPWTTIKTPDWASPYITWLLRFLRREIPHQPDMWSLELTADQIRLRTDHRTGPVESTTHTLQFDQQTSRQLARFLQGDWIDCGEARIRLRDPVSLITAYSGSVHDGGTLTLPECVIERRGIPDPILYAIEATPSGLILHLQFPLTRAKFTVAVI